MGSLTDLLFHLTGLKALMWVTLLIWIGLFFYLRRVEAKVEQLEKRN
jgi:hypothetical protein